MGIPIDSSRTYRWPSELVELVEAVTHTDPANESTWIEWKSMLNLDDKSGHYHIAKHVLGFANRTVATARAHADGYAYMIVGAEPGGVTGISPVDPAVLRPKIVRYVGPAVRWRAEFVSVRDVPVLVVVVDPPQQGDPIYPVRHQLDGHPKGRILVRRAGATDVANDFEVDQLVERARSAEDCLDISVEPISTVIERKPVLPDPDELAETERAATLARPRADAARPGRDPFGISTVVARASIAAMSVLMEPDDRSDEDYEEEVDRYCERYKHAVLARCLWRLWRHRPIWLQLEAVNATENNFTDIELEVHVPSDVRSWPDEDYDVSWGKEPRLPERPNVLGTPKQKFSGFDYPAPLASFAIEPYRAPASYDSGPSFTVRDTGSVTIEFAGIDLRPRQRCSLPVVRLLVDSPEGTVLACRWKATATNARGQMSGSFSLTVGQSTLTFDNINIDSNDEDADDE